jgi:predicted Ser/Thr protein kinase
MLKTVSTSQVQNYLENIQYPCTQQDLFDTAEGEGADADVLDILDDLPEREYESPIDVNRAINDIER